MRRGVPQRRGSRPGGQRRLRVPRRATAKAEPSLGSTWVNGGVTFPLTAGRFVTATRHVGGAVRDTSEFSQCLVVGP